MWQMNETRQLTVEQPGSTWLRERLLAECARVAEDLRITGSQTYTSRVPADDASDYLGFKVILNSTLRSDVRFGYVLDDQDSFAARASSISEALAELAHGAAFGDTDMETSLHALVGEEIAERLQRTAATNV